MITLRKAGKTVATIAVLAAVSMSVSGCGALIVGYMVGDAMQKSKATDTCRNNLNNINQARISKGEQPFPDQCG